MLVYAVAAEMEHGSLSIAGDMGYSRFHQSTGQDWRNDEVR